MTTKTKTSQILETLPSKPGAMRIIALGGLGEFGLNCTVFEYEGEMLMVDCGQMMPEKDMPGIDSVIPDMQFVQRHAKQLRGIWITHAHEDHIGALPHVLPALGVDVPIYASEFTAALMREKFEEYDLKPEFRIYEGRQKYRVGKAFECEPIAVTHSLVQTFAVAIRTPAGVAIHTADYKIDPSPRDGVAFDHFAFARYSEEPDGVLALLSDSTNSDRRGSCPSECEVIPRLTQLIREATSTVVVSCFASSVHRIQTIMDIAAETGRTVFAAGLNMERVIRVARKLELLEVRCPYNDDSRGLESVPRTRRLILTTGSQGEPMSGLSRIALGTHKFVRLEAGDLAIISARMIPGNEKAIYTMINNLSKRGVRVCDERSTPGIHVSGHGYRDDIKHMINLVNPRFVVPIHGEHRQLQAHQELARELGLRDEEVLMVETGDCLEFHKDEANILGKVPHGRVLVDGSGIGDVGEVVLRDRMHLAQDGMVILTVAIDHESGEVLSGPDFATRGFVSEEESGALLKDARDIVLAAITSEGPDASEDAQTMQAAIKKELRGFFKKRTGRFPVILSFVQEV